MKKIIALFLALVAIPHMGYAQSSAEFQLLMAKPSLLTSTATSFATIGAPYVPTAATAYAPAVAAAGGGTAVTAAANVAVGASKAAVVVKGAATAANIFAAAKLLAMGGTGVVGVGLTVLTMAPMVVDYLTTENTRLGPESARNSDKPFQKKSEESNCPASGCVEYRASYSNSAPWHSSRGSACNAFVSENAGSYGEVSVGNNSCTVFKNKVNSEGNPYVEIIAVWNFQSRIVPPSTNIEWLPASWDDIAPYMDTPDKVVSGDQFKALLDAGAKIQAKPTSITGPAEVVEAPVKTTTETAEKTTTTTTTKKTKLDYTTAPDPATGQPTPVVNATPVTSTVVTETNKTTNVTTIISTTNTEVPKAPDAEKIIVCGLPDTPPCKIDESETPAELTENVYAPKLDDYKQKQDELRDKAAGSADKGFFASWGSVFVTPPLAACTGYDLPRDMGKLDPCPVVDGVRTIMAYVWALTALFMAVGMVKKVI